LPDEGPVPLGPVALPAWRLITGYPGRDHAAWATMDPVPESGRVWAALSELHPRTGLVPIQLDGADFVRPEDPREADGLDAGLAGGRVALLGADPARGRPRVGRDAGAVHAGVARAGRAERMPLTPAERQRALDVVLPRIRLARSATPSARVGLVAAGLPMCCR